MSVPLQAGDAATLDLQYQIQMKELTQSWIQKRGPAANPHTQAKFAFVSTKHHPEFQAGATFSWVHNTLIALSTDLAETVIVERTGWYFPTTQSTAGVMMPDGLMKFIKIEPGGKLALDAVADVLADASEDGPIRATGDVSMGMLVESIYAAKGWTEGLTTS